MNGCVNFVLLILFIVLLFCGPIGWIIAVALLIMILQGSKKK